LRMGEGRSLRLPSFLFPSSLPFRSPSTFPSKVRPQLQGLGERCKLSQWGRSRTPAENEFGALERCQKATGGNHFEYSEYHALQQNDQNLALDSDGVSPSSKGEGVEPARTPSKSATEKGIFYYETLFVK